MMVRKLLVMMIIKDNGVDGNDEDDDGETGENAKGWGTTWVSFSDSWRTFRSTKSR